MCHSLHITGMWLTRCVSLDCSSASLMIGSSFARSRLRNTWTTYSASWARKGMQLWTTGSQLMKLTNKIWRNSLTILKAPWMMRSPPEFEYMSLRISRRGLMNPLMNSERIHQLTHHAQIGDGSNAAIEFEVQCRLIWVIPDANIKLHKELLKVSHDKKVSIYWRLVIHIMLLSPEQLQCALAKPFTLSSRDVSPINSLYISWFHSAATVPIHTLLAMTSALHSMLSARVVPRKATGRQSATAVVLPASNSLSLMELRSPPSSMLWKGEESWYSTS